MSQQPELVWVNTPGYNDYQVAGKPLHAIVPGTSKTYCGIRRSKWSADLFNDQKCERCVKALAKVAKV